MKKQLKIFWAAMIIASAPICPLHAQTVAPVAVRMPDHVEFTHAMELGDLAQASLWLDAGLDPEFAGSRVGSGLMIAAWEGNIELMRLFLSHGADINRTNANGESALALAAWRGNLAAVKWLIERSARINPPGRQWSPLHYAVFSGHQEVVNFLLAQGADINALSTNGSSVLMMAVYEGRADLAKKLVDLGARRDVRNDWGDGALEWAMRNNNLELARMVSAPEVFSEAVSKPKETWGEPRRSFQATPELEALNAMRNTLAECNLSTPAIDRRIASERARIVRSEIDSVAPQRVQTLEVSASRRKPGDQSVRVIRKESGEAVGGGFAVPPATRTGPVKAPIKAPTRNY